MYDPLARERLLDILEMLEQIPDRMAHIKEPAAFRSTKEGRIYLDSICMLLLASGEALKKVDSNLLKEYPQIVWSGPIGLRDVLAHGYLGVDIAQIFEICNDHVPQLIDTLRIMIRDMDHDARP